MTTHCRTSGCSPSYHHPRQVVLIECTSELLLLDPAHIAVPLVACACPNVLVLC